MKTPPFLTDVLDNTGKFSIPWRQWLTGVANLGTIESPTGVLGVRNDSISITSPGTTITADAFSDPIRIPGGFFSSTRLAEVTSYFTIDSLPFFNPQVTIDYYFDGALYATIGVLPGAGVSDYKIRCDCAIKTTTSGSSVPLAITGGATVYNPSAVAVENPPVYIPVALNINTSLDHSLSIKMTITDPGTPTLTHDSTRLLSYLG